MEYKTDDIYMRRFLQYWNKDIDKVPIQKSHNDTADRYYIAVVTPKRVMIFEVLSSFAYECFRRVFNGSVCDIEHWEYFENCMEKMSIYLTGDKDGLYWCAFEGTIPIEGRLEDI